jgi:5S rRNA maturation endonuclease (ribonuclease M5)
MDSRKLDHVIRELNQYSGPKKSAGSESTFVLCPFHSENTPSGRIFHSQSTKSPGYFRCYGCGKKAPWDEVAPKLGLKPYQWAKPSVQYAYALRKRDEQVVRKLKFCPLPANKVWRGIKTNFLLRFGAQMCIALYDDGIKSAKMLYFPVMVKSELRGYIRARVRKVEDKPSYLNAPGPWSHDYGLFMYDYAVDLMIRLGLKTIVLCEGPRDAIRLNSLRIPAIAILGTTSWSKRKSQLVEMTGAKVVILAFDGDDAGLKAIELVQPELESMIKVKIFDLTAEDSPYWPYRDEDEPSKAAKAAGVDLWDPGNMPIRKVKELRACLI